MTAKKGTDYSPAGSSSTMQRKAAEKKPEKGVFIDRGKAIPAAYNETKIIILPRDPNWIYSYWDISRETASSLMKKYGQSLFRTSKAVLRAYDITGILMFDGKNARSYLDTTVNIDAKSWYLKLENADRKNFCVDLGLITKDGTFIKIARSNVILMPAGRISEITDEEWMIIQEDFAKLLRLSGEGMIGKSSGEAVQMLLMRMEKMLFAQKMGGSGLVSSFGFKPEQAGESPKKGFWLIADAELIVYGATEKDASVTVKGDPIRLKDDGSFHMRFALPDGSFDIPIEATAADGSDRRKITITVKRDTK